MSDSIDLGNQLNSYYIDRINLVVNHIEQHLEEDLSLDNLSKIAGISKFHFHRIFSFFSGETLHQFITRKRVEKIAHIVLNNPKQSIRTLGMTYGFDNPTSFSRAFKKYYGVSARDLRKSGNDQINQILRNKSKIGKVPISIQNYIYNVDETRHWLKNYVKMDIYFPLNYSIAYVRHQGSFDKVIETFFGLKRWVQRTNEFLLKDPKWIMIIHDNPAITESEKMTQSAGILLEQIHGNQVRLTPEVSKMTIPEGRYLRGRCHISDTDFKKAWDAMCIYMVDHNLVPRDGYYFELFHGNSLFTNNQEHQLELMVPI